jgi:hypothetical protein
MRGSLILPMLVYAALVGGASAKGVACRAQILWSCDDKGCENSLGPTDLSLDFDKKTVSYCRGEGCTDGKLSLYEFKGQWDEKTYTAFQASGDGFKIEGILMPGQSVFHAETDDVGTIAGNCKPN